jgi:class 3 adenylate cyclase
MMISRSLLLLLWFSVFNHIYTQAQSVKAQRVIEIAKGFTWSEFQNDKFIIGVMDDKSLDTELSEWAKNNKVANKIVEIRRFSYNFQVKPSHIVFIGNQSSANTFLDVIRDKMRNFPAIIITEKSGMLAEGSHINFLDQGGNIRYEVNRPVVEGLGLGINPALLPNAISRDVKVQEETSKLSLKLPDLKRKEKSNAAEEEEQAEEVQTERKKKKRNTKTAEEPAESHKSILIDKLAVEKNATNQQIQSLKAYIQGLEQKLDENKIDYQTLKQKFEVEQGEAEKEIASLNLTIIEKDSLRKKDALLSQKKIELVESEKKLAIANSRMNWYIAISAIFVALLLGFTAFVFYRDKVVINRQNQELAQNIEQIQQQKEEITAQRDEIEAQKNKIEQESIKSEKLLLNILPAQTAQELKEKGYATPKSYEMASVLFTDFKGFTNIAAQMTPDEIIQELDQCFLAFDEISEKNKLERIKTIGDSYMCVGGLPEANQSNPIDTVNAAIEMQAFMNQRKEERNKQGKPFFECRIGIHTGKVVAGVVGKKKFAYDIWGDTVNMASRMESSGEVNQINISGATFELIKNKFECDYRGKINAKGKGEVDMYFVKHS